MGVAGAGETAASGIRLIFPFLSGGNKKFNMAE